jgi:hypothetical protein
MSDASSSSGSSHGAERRTIGDYATSSLLVAFTLVVGISCAIFLASTLTQTRMSGITVNGVNINIWKLNEIRQKWSGIQKQIEDMTKELAAAEVTRREIATHKLKVEAGFAAKQSELQVALIEYNLRVAEIKSEGATGPRPVTGDLANQYWAIQTMREAIDRDHPALRPIIENVEKAYADYRPARTSRNEVRQLSDAIAPEIKIFQDAIDGTRTSLDKIFEQVSIKLDEGTRARVENVLYELNSGWLSTTLNPLITLQPDILTLSLVILMGVLGSSLQITYSFFRGQQAERIGVYFLRVCVGAITALVIFIVAKAGVPVIADASRLGGDAPINPYFVSFLAIISGLMSERAILSVQTQAARFFGPEGAGETARWARRDLRPDFEKGARKPAEVQKLLNAEDAEFEDWISGTKAMPPSAQNMISGALGIPVRDLFTDIAPEQAVSS